MALALAAASAWALAGFSEDNKRENNTMSFQAPFSITDYARMQMLADQERARQQQSYMSNIFSGINQLGGIAAEADDAANMLAGMDTTAKAMKDEGIIDQDTLTKYLNAPNQERRFLFQNFLAPQMGAFNAGNAAEAQAAAYARYRGSGVGGVPAPTGAPTGGFQVF